MFFYLFFISRMHSAQHGEAHCMCRAFFAYIIFCHLPTAFGPSQWRPASRFDTFHPGKVCWLCLPPTVFFILKCCVHHKRHHPSFAFAGKHPSLLPLLTPTNPPCFPFLVLTMAWAATPWTPESWLGDTGSSAACWERRCPSRPSCCCC